MADEARVVYVRENLFAKWFDRFCVFVLCVLSLWIGVMASPYLPKEVGALLTPPFLRDAVPKDDPANVDRFVTKEEWQEELNRTRLFLDEKTSQISTQAGSAVPTLNRQDGEESRPADRTKPFGRPQ